MDIPKFLIYKDSVTNLYQYILWSGKHVMLLFGNKCMSKQSCLKEIQKVKFKAQYNIRYDKMKQGDIYTFKLTCTNGNIIGVSNKYNTSSEREDAIASIKKEAGSAVIECYL